MHWVAIKFGKTAVVLLLLLFICYNLYSKEKPKAKISKSRIYDKLNNTSFLMNARNRMNNSMDYNIWIIFTKVAEKSPLTFKFKKLVVNLIAVTTVPLTFHLFVDETSRAIAVNYFESLYKFNKQKFIYEFYDVSEAASNIKDIVVTMTPYFSSKPGTYYSDALFYLSLGLYKIAPANQDKAVMLDCDLYFKKDIALLFDEFKKFSPTHLFGLAPELTPVYRHVLHYYRTKHKTSFGEFFHVDNKSTGLHRDGYQGYNSGVILFNLTAIRQSTQYEQLLSPENVKNITRKYKFKGHLGDQDFYTLLGYDHPNLIKPLDCGFNRQLCTWWRDNGYKNVFNFYSKCDSQSVILHGNCNTKIPTLD